MSDPEDPKQNKVEQQMQDIQGLDQEALQEIGQILEGHGVEKAPTDEVTLPTQETRDYDKWAAELADQYAAPEPAQDVQPEKEIEQAEPGE